MRTAIVNNTQEFNYSDVYSLLRELFEYFQEEEPEVENVTIKLEDGTQGVLNMAIAHYCYANGTFQASKLYDYTFNNEKPETTYKIKMEFTDPYNRSKYGGDRVISEGLSLKKAYSELLDLYNDKFDYERPWCPNWGLAVIQSGKYCDGASPTFSDKTRSFTWDVRRYVIYEEEI